jgi:hypothetical protein
MTTSSYTDHPVEFAVDYAHVVTEHGVELALIDLAITRAKTRRRPPGEHVLAELRIAALQDRVHAAKPRRP